MANLTREYLDRHRDGTIEARGPDATYDRPEEFALALVDAALEAAGRQLGDDEAEVVRLEVQVEVVPVDEPQGGCVTVCAIVNGRRICRHQRGR